ncbi:MAG: cysteine hydrolase [Chloroflexota bacterium]
MVHRTPLPNLFPPAIDRPIAASDSALVLLDFQRCYVDRAVGIGRLAAERGIDAELDEYFEQVAYAVRNARDLLHAFRAAGVTVIHCRIVDRPRMTPSTVQSGVIGWLRSASDADADFCADLAPAPGEVVVERRALNPFVRSDLERVVEDRGLSTLVLAGVGVATTVYPAARDAADRGYAVIGVPDACVGDTFEIHDFMLNQLVGGLIRLRSTAAVLAAMQGGAS